MSHSRPIPEASVSPYPLHPAPIASIVRSDISDVHATPSNAAGYTGGKAIGITTGALAIGSAAIVAALIFYNRTTNATPVKHGRSPRTTAKSVHPK